MGIERIVDVQISRETQAVSQVGFGTALVLGSSNKLVSKIQSFDSIEAVEALFTSGDPELDAARAYFGQERRPELLYIAQRDANVAQVNNVEATDATDGTYSVVINGTSFDFVASSSTTAAIVAGLLAAVNGGAEPVTASAGAGDSIDLTADVAGVPFTISVVSPNNGLALTETTANVDIDTELQAISDINDDWYCLISASRVVADILKAADFIQARRKIYIAASSDADIFTTATTDIASLLKAQALDRTAVIALKGGVTDFPDAAWAGLILPLTPGSVTWKFKTLVGVTVDVLNPTELNNALGKNANIYVTTGGVNITCDGTMASGEFIDIIRGVDFIQARITERVFSRLVNSNKIPYTNAGINIIRDAILSVLNENKETANNIQALIAADPEPVVTAPDALDVDSTDRINRVLPNVTFTARLAGAIHKVIIRGTVTV